MEALLIDEWLRGVDDPLLILDDASLSVARERVRTVGAAAGASTDVIDRACLVVTEIGKNHLRHARAGRIAVRAVMRADAAGAGLEITGVDRGEGLADVAAAIDASPRVQGTLGIGVSSIRRLSSEVDFDVRLGEGTRIVARVLDREARRQREVGIYGRPFPGEKVSGDHASFARSSRHNNNRLILTVCDGLGHGIPAREAATEAVRVFDSHTTEPPVAIVEACHVALEATRGVVMAIALMDDAALGSTVELCSVGNIDLQISAPRSARRFGGSSAIIGGRGNARPKPRSETAPFAQPVGSGGGDVLLMTTDGISSKLAIDQELMLLREHPIVIAQRIMERWGRTTDDALVLVVR